MTIRCCVIRHLTHRALLFQASKEKEIELKTVNGPQQGPGGEANKLEDSLTFGKISNKLTVVISQLIIVSGLVDTLIVGGYTFEGSTPMICSGFWDRAGEGFTCPAEPESLPRAPVTGPITGFRMSQRHNWGSSECFQPVKINEFGASIVGRSTMNRLCLPKISSLPLSKSSGFSHFYPIHPKLLTIVIC